MLNGNNYYRNSIDLSLGLSCQTKGSIRMTKYMTYEKQENIKNTIVSTPTNVSNLDFESLYEEINGSWRDKAQKLQIRRMRKLSKQLI